MCGGVRCQSKDGHNEDNDDIELTAELDLWTGPVGAGHRHPLEHYTLRAIEPFTDDRGKCMVHPEHMAGFQVTAVSLGACKCQAPPPCALICRQLNWLALD